ncbi:hypothetical protein [Bacillus thuringiensis]|uniref:hypothetical protein n=1 Tax=Bacillus thuringiensis TaxID=1428 RepID=UPI000BFCB5A6|nr:hypothetical protein [Bacillus thuringiensis]PGT90129.1 hypothetical protein COD17_10290 [Bacillus thuringiensis]
MQFIDHLTETEESLIVRETLKDLGRPPSVRMYEAILFEDGIHLSIQASACGHCRPQETVDLEKYTAMEVALVRCGEYVEVKDVLPNFKRLTDTENVYFGGIFYSFMPVDLIEDVFLALKEEYGLKE